MNPMSSAFATLLLGISLFPALPLGMSTLVCIHASSLSPPLINVPCFLWQVNRSIWQCAISVIVMFLDVVKTQSCPLLPMRFPCLILKKPPPCCSPVLRYFPFPQFPFPGSFPCTLSLSPLHINLFCQHCSGISKFITNSIWTRFQTIKSERYCTKNGISFSACFLFSCVLVWGLVLWPFFPGGKPDV